MSDKHTPNTCEYSKSHTSESHPDRHVDQYNYDSNGKKTDGPHGISLSGKIMNIFDDFFGSSDD